MHLRQLENNIGLCIAAELNKFFYNAFIIEISELFRYKFSFCFYARGFIKLVIAAQIVFIQQQVHLFAAAAAKTFVVRSYYFIAGIAAMIAGCFYGAF